MIHQGQRYWYHPEPKPGEPHEPRNTPWPGDILRVHPNGPYLRVVEHDVWITYEWVKPFLFFWWRRVSKRYLITQAEWYNFVGNTDVVHIAREKHT